MKRIVVIGLIAVLFLTSCASSRHALTGAAIGGIAGTIIAGEKGGWLGAILGAVLGNELDQARTEKQYDAYWKRRIEMQQKAAQESVRIIEVDADTEVVVVENGKAIKY